MSRLHRRVFRRYRRRFIPLLTALAAMATVLVAEAALHLGALPGLALLGLYLLLLFDRAILFGNGWLRHRLTHRLRAYGELVDHGADRFVGLAHPCRVHDLGRRIIETDDDVGFLTVSIHGLHYRGDALSFDIPAARIESVAYTRSLAAPWGRVEVSIAGGEPFDRLILDSRQYASHARCRSDNRRLYQQLRGLQMLGGPIAPRLAAREQAEADLQLIA